MPLPKRKIGDNIKEKVEKLSKEQNEDIDLNNLNFNTLGNISAEDLGLKIKDEVEKNIELEKVDDKVFVDNKDKNILNLDGHPSFEVKYIKLLETMAKTNGLLV